MKEQNMNTVISDYKKYKNAVKDIRDNFLKLLISLPKNSFVITDIATQLDNAQKDICNIYIYFEPEKSKEKSLPIKFKTGKDASFLYISKSINFPKDKLYTYYLMLFGKDEPDIFQDTINSGYVINEGSYRDRKGFKLYLDSSKDTTDLKEFIDKQLGIPKNPILKDTYASIKQSILDMLSK